MNPISFKIIDRKIVIKSKGRMCETAEELMSSSLFVEMLKRTIDSLLIRRSLLLNIFGVEGPNKKNVELLKRTLAFLCKMPGNLIPKVVNGSEIFFHNPSLFNEFVEYLYNFWRSFDRFIICDSEGDTLDKRPYRTFNDTIEKLTHLVRATYRDLQENITEKHPQIYRQVRAGAEIAAIALLRKTLHLMKPYEKLNSILMIRQILLYPPLVLNPTMNKRTGRFEKIDQNPLTSVDINEEEWLCYPARVGPLLIFIYFHERFFELGFALCNLFELADDECLQKRPDAIYAFGVPGSALDNYATFPTVFFDDVDNDILVAAVPNRDEFGYFGYLKKMVLTLHNIKMMKQGRFPFHGALVNIILKDGRDATVLLIGDTGAGKSETLEAFRVLGKEYIREMIVIADDMGSLEIGYNGEIIGYGTEIGAFLRLDDLQPGYAFGQIDRSIFMSPSQVNARIVLPVTTFDNVIKGYEINFICYANNYEEVDEEHPIIEKFNSSEHALRIFREGAVMSKGTTTSQGLMHSYFANIFGPPQYKEMHDKLALQYFNAFYNNNVFVGQLRTRLGIPGYEIKGPELAAKELFKLLSSS